MIQKSVERAVNDAMTAALPPELQVKIPRPFVDRPHVIRETWCIRTEWWMFGLAFRTNERVMEYSLDPDKRIVHFSVLKDGYDDIIEELRSRLTNDGVTLTATLH